MFFSYVSADSLWLSFHHKSGLCNPRIMMTCSLIPIKLDVIYMQWMQMELNDAGILHNE